MFGLFLPYGLRCASCTSGCVAKASATAQNPAARPRSLFGPTRTAPGKASIQMDWTEAAVPRAGTRAPECQGPQMAAIGDQTGGTQLSSCTVTLYWLQW